MHVSGGGSNGYSVWPVPRRVLDRCSQAVTLLGPWTSPWRTVIASMVCHIVASTIMDFEGSNVCYIVFYCFVLYWILSHCFLLYSLTSGTFLLRAIFGISFCSRLYSARRTTARRYFRETLCPGYTRQRGRRLAMPDREAVDIFSMIADSSFDVIHQDGVSSNWVSDQSFESLWSSVSFSCFLLSWWLSQCGRSVAFMSGQLKEIAHLHTDYLHTRRRTCACRPIRERVEERCSQSTTGSEDVDRWRPGASHSCGIFGMQTGRERCPWWLPIGCGWFAVSCSRVRLC